MNSKKHKVFGGDKGLVGLVAAVRTHSEQSDALLREIELEQDGLAKTLALRPRPQIEGDNIRRHRTRLLDKIAKREQIAAKVQGLIAPYAQESCRELCSAVLQNLPREIRDMVYAYVHAHDAIYVGPEYMHRSMKPPETDRDAHYWDTSYTGLAMHDEMVESWYRTTLFYFYDKANNAQVIRQFLEFDRWQLGKKPSDLIYKVKFELGTAAFGVHSSLRKENLAEVITRPLEDLDRLPNHVHFLLRIHLNQELANSTIGDEELREIVKAILNRLVNFKKAGHRFTVHWADVPELEFVSKSDGLDVDSWMGKLKHGASNIHTSSFY